MTRIFELLFLITMVSCAAALVPETSDPNEKLKQSYELVAGKRGIAAEKVIGQAMQIFQAKGNKEGIARAYYAYALLYRSDASHDRLKLPDNYRAGEAYDIAGMIYKQLGNRKAAVDTYILAALLYGLGKEMDRSGPTCNTLIKAKTAAGKESQLIAEVVHHQKKMRCI
jgi:hypothetical protein